MKLWFIQNKGGNMLKKLKVILCSGLITIGVCFIANAQDFVFEEEMVEESQPEIIEVSKNTDETQDKIADQISVDALDNYDVSGSLFEKITLLEQDKVVLQLEKERAQLDLELERLNAEKFKLQMELDTLSGRAENQQQELEAAKAQLEAQAEKIKRQKESLDEQEDRTQVVTKPSKPEIGAVSSRYKVINVVGVGNQLQATIEEISSGQNKRIAVGKQLDGYTVKSISLNDGIVFEKDGVFENLNIGK